MVKKPPKKTKTSNGAKLGKIKSWFIRSPWWAKILVAFLVLVLVSIANAAYQQRQLERRFDRLEVDLTMLFESSEVPHSTDKHCFRESFKYSEGPLRCKIETSFSNGSIRPEAVISTLKSSPSWSVQSEIENRAGSYLVDINNLGTKTLCRLNISRNLEKKINSLSISCSEKSKRAFYPYRD